MGLVCPVAAGCRDFVARSAVSIQRKYKITDPEINFDEYVYCLLFFRNVSVFYLLLSQHKHTLQWVHNTMTLTDPLQLHFELRHRRRPKSRVKESKWG